MDQNELKKLAAEKAVESIKSEMIVGLGTGSTAYFAIKKIGELLASGELKDVLGIPTSVSTANIAREFNIPLTTLDKHPHIDVTIDGADEVDTKLNLIKGGGGALLREKVIAQATKKQIIVVDETKISDNLGEKWAVPVEVLKMATVTENLFLKSIGAETKPRIDEKDHLVTTDEGNLIIDANFGKIKDPQKLAQLLENRAGIVEHGLFIGLTDEVIVASSDGIKILNVI